MLLKRERKTGFSELLNDSAVTLEPRTLQALLFRERTTLRKNQRTECVHLVRPLKFF